MLSVQQSYSRLFRPWDVSETKDDEHVCATTVQKETKKRRKIDESKRENRLRKIRGVFKKSETNIHQDATVSTTTDENDSDSKKMVPAKPETCLENTENPVASLTSCCDRLLQEPKDPKPDKLGKMAETKNSNERSDISKHTQFTDPCIVPQMTPYGMPYPDYLPTTELAQVLGVPPSDPLFLESIAQGYAMELEYARIIQQETEAKINARKQRPKKYKCPHCHVGFSNNGQLKGHIRIHTGERPYKCDEKNCGKTFTRNEELTRHKRIHSGVRPYPCQTCGKKFGRRDHLKKHTRTHFLQAERMLPVFVPLSAVPHSFPYLYGY